MIPQDNPGKQKLIDGFFAHPLIRKINPSELGRFIVVGCANTTLDFCVFWITVHKGNIPLVVANLMAWIIAFTFSYFVNGRWTFGRSWRVLRQPIYYARLAGGGLLSLVFATSVLLLLVAYLPLAVAKIASIAAGFCGNFLVAKYFPTS